MHACKCHVVGQARKEALEAANAAYIAQEKMGIISVSIPLNLNTTSKYDTRSRENAHAIRRHTRTAQSGTVQSHTSLIHVPHQLHMCHLQTNELHRPIDSAHSEKQHSTRRKGATARTSSRTVTVRSSHLLS